MTEEQPSVQDQEGAPPGGELLVRPKNEPVPHSGADLVEQTRVQRTVHLWATSRRVPLAFKPSRLVPDARPARREMAVHLVKLPTVYLPLAAGRGAFLWCKAWHDWVQVNDFRHSAKADGRFSDKAETIRNLSLLRWKVTGGALLGAALGLYLLLLFATTMMLVALAVLLLFMLVMFGRTKDGAPGRKPTLGTARAFGWTMDPEMLNVAFRDAGVLKKDESLRLVKHAHHDGKGWNITVDLPGTRKASDAIAKHEDLASALALDEICLYLERVRGDGGHAGRLNLWAAAKDPYGGDPVPFPLVREQSWDAWKPAPFGMDARDRKIPLGLVWSNLLIGAKPGMGKSFAARLAASPFVLDPYVQIYAWNGKGNRDWRAIEQVAHRHGKGDSDEEVVRLRDTLAELKAEAQRRFAAMNDMDDDECPDGKLTREISRTPRHKMPLTLVVIDELQNYLENSEPGWKVQGKKATVGQNIAALLTWLAKNGRALGIVLLLATQRPDAASMPTGLRSQMGTRFGLKVMDWRDSNMILGDQMNTRGYDCSKLLGSHLGVGILRPDGELGGVEAGCPTVRTYLMRGAEWTELCERGRALREAAGTLTGQAAGESVVLDAVAVATAAAEAEHERPTVDDRIIDAEFTELPSPLDVVVDYLARDLNGDGRSFVSTRELAERVGGISANQLAERLRDLLGVEPKPTWVHLDDGTKRQQRGYRMADLKGGIATFMDHSQA
ncbi:cell division protein FtsK [Pseudonocardia alni]|uniref:cell division protein FtsK n=1 Tax=Pseudonocardia alni TaxID=33907 RepID=UPI0033EDE9F4